MAHINTTSNSSSEPSLIICDYSRLALIAAMARQWAFQNFNKCEKIGAGEGVRTLDFHLGNPTNHYLSWVYLYYPSLLNVEVFHCESSISYNRFYPVSTPLAATLRQWKPDQFPHNHQG